MIIILCGCVIFLPKSLKTKAIHGERVKKVKTSCQSKIWKRRMTWATGSSIGRRWGITVTLKRSIQMVMVMIQMVMICCAVWRKQMRRMAPVGGAEQWRREEQAREDNANAVTGMGQSPIIICRGIIENNIRDFPKWGRGEIRGIFRKIMNFSPTFFIISLPSYQGGLICGAIEECSRSLKVIVERIFLNFCDKNVVFNFGFIDRKIFYW